MTKQEEENLWTQILEPLARMAVINDYLASHPDIEQKLTGQKIEEIIAKVN